MFCIRILAATVIVALLAMNTPLLAQQGNSGASDLGWNFGVGVSTAGVTARAQYRFDERFALRGFVGSAIVARFDGQVSDVDYDFRARLGGVGLLADYYFWRDARISGGVFYSYNSVRARARGDLTVGETDYRGVGIEGDVTFTNKFAPMVTLGYDLPLGKSFYFTGEVGAIYTGGFAIDLRQTGGPTIGKGDLRVESRQFRDSALDVVPFVSLMVGYRF